MNTPFISIIVPVYNSEKFLHECISSILTQKYTNFELILIDDGSTDTSSSICKKYIEKDNRIVYFHKENGGVSSARNLGLTKAQGKWVTFIDSDDTVSENYLSDLIAQIQCEKLLIIQNMDGACIDLEECTLSNQKMINYYLTNKVSLLTGPVAKLYNRLLIIQNNITFPVGIHMGEDAIFILRYLKYIDTLNVTNHTNYYIRKHEGSLTTRYNTFESEYNCYKLWKEALLNLVTKYPLYSNPLPIIWKSRVSYTFKRVFKSIAYSKNCSIKSKLSLFKEIQDEDLKEFKLYYNIENNKDRVFYFLICNKLYFSYLFIEWINKKLSH